MQEVAAARGIDVASLFDNDKLEKDAQRMTGTGGVYLCDFNRDGYLDMLVTDMNLVWLYKGLPGGKFEDVTKKVGLPPRLMGFGGAAAFIDIDGDGWDDLILGDTIFRNDGGKGFTDVSGQCNLRVPLKATGITVVTITTATGRRRFVHHQGRRQKVAIRG